MRFRCTVGREQFKLLYDHVALLERIGKNAIVHWAKDACRMIVITDDEHLLLYTTLNTVRHHLVKSVCLRTRQDRRAAPCKYAVLTSQQRQ
jgi:hypothetical protein